MNTYKFTKIGSVISLPRKLLKGAESIETVMYIHSILYNIIGETHSPSQSENPKEKRLKKKLASNCTNLSGTL